MRSSTRILLGATTVVLIGWGIAILVASLRERQECSIGASLEGCAFLDEVLLFAFYALPAVMLLLAALLILNWKPRSRRER